MMYKKPAPPNATMVPTPYEFCEPVKLKIRKPDGTEILMGYGIGEKIEVLEPHMQFCIPSHEKWKEIPLADGSFVIEYPSNMKTRRAYL